MRQLKPDWLKILTKTSGEKEEIEKLLSTLSLHTVCEEANCPNLSECFCDKTAAFMILGSVCTRNCTFCNVMKGIPQDIDWEEPQHVAEAVAALGLKHAVITSVTRDDLQDGGASHFVKVIHAIRNHCPSVTIEVLTPDFQGEVESLKMIVRAKPEIINHNIETVKRLYPMVRPTAVYNRSLDFLAEVKKLDSSILTKSGIMLGFGETKDEVLQVLSDLREKKCDFLTIGQYLSPSRTHLPVIEFVHPDKFDEYRIVALKMGFTYVASGPLVRSSYHAGRTLML